MMVDPSVRIKILEEKNKKLQMELDTAREEIATLKSRLAMKVFTVPIEWGLTPSQNEYLNILYSKYPNVVSRNIIHFFVYQNGKDTEIKIVDVQICKIRSNLRNLFDQSIHTVRGIGYVLDKEVFEILSKINGDNNVQT